MVAPRAGRPEAAAEIWSLRQSISPAASRATPGRLRLLGSLQALALAALGSALFLYWSQTLGRILLSLSAIILLSALASPTVVYQGLLQLVRALGQITARAMTWILWVPLFYGVFLPFGLLFRRGSRDRLRRTITPGALSYWEPHAGPTAASASRRRQY